MIEDKVGLILEGGGMRGAYTAGVLDYFLEAGYHFPLVSTASSGAFIGAYYISRQRGQIYQALQEMMSNPESISIRRLLAGKGLFRMDFIFDQIPKQRVPFDFGSFSRSPAEYIIGTTDKQSGGTIYYDSYRTLDELFTLACASSSLPILSEAVEYEGRNLVDGGVSDPIPIQPSLARGCRKHVVVLTRNRGYIKKATKLNWLFKLAFQRYPELRKLLKERHIIYNRTMKMIIEMESRGEVLILQPEKPLVASRIERNEQLLKDLYFQGYEETKRRKVELEQFLHTNVLEYHG